MRNDEAKVCLFLSNVVMTWTEQLLWICCRLIQRLRLCGIFVRLGVNVNVMNKVWLTYLTVLFCLMWSADSQSWNFGVVSRVKIQHWNRPISVCVLCIFWILSWFSSFLSHSTHMSVSYSGNPELPCSVLLVLRMEEWFLSKGRICLKRWLADVGCAHLRAGWTTCLESARDISSARCNACSSVCSRTSKNTQHPARHIF